MKNRILSCFIKYGISFDETTSDAFNGKGRAALQTACSMLPVHTRESVTQLLAQLDGTNRAIAELEERMREVSSQTPTVQLLQTIPGIGPILSHVIAYEIGDIMRFASARHLAEAAYWVITTKSPYKEPQHARVNTVVSSKKG